MDKQNLSKLTKEEFYEKYCSYCGSQRCEGIDTVWFEGCKYKDLLLLETDDNYNDQNRNTL